MQHALPDMPDTLGADLRALRKARGMTLNELADGLGRSVGWLSQVERDISEPSITDLRHIAAALGVSVSMLFRHAAAPAAEAGYVVRRDASSHVTSHVFVLRRGLRRRLRGRTLLPRVLGRERRLRRPLRVPAAL